MQRRDRLRTLNSAPALDPKGNLQNSDGFEIPQDFSNSFVIYHTRLSLLTTELILKPSAPNGHRALWS